MLLPNHHGFESCIVIISLHGKGAFKIYKHLYLILKLA